MNVLVLGNESAVSDFLIESGENVTIKSDQVSPEDVKHMDFVVSYGYRHIIPEDVIEVMPKRFVNLHISFLPWNRGADPNLWSWIDDTPNGVTIHIIDEKLDTGPILLQKEVEMSDNETLRSSYKKLSDAIEDLFMKNWLAIKNHQILGMNQIEKGTYHRKNQKQPILDHFGDKWLDVPVSEIIDYAKQVLGSNNGQPNPIQKAEG